MSAFEEICRGLPDEVVAVLGREYVPDKLAHKAGWHAPNSVTPSNCRPVYTLPGGGVFDEDLTDLQTALEKSRNNLLRRRDECDRLIKRMDRALHALRG